MIKIDKSRFNAEDLAKYEELIAKGSVEVDPEAAQEEMENEMPDTNEPKGTPTDTPDAAPEGGIDKSVSPEIKAALERMEALAKSVEMKEFAEIAKKYAPLGEKEDELAKKLYDMKKSDEGIYKSYIEILDKSLGLVEKSGLFAEIGKSCSGGKSSGCASDKAKAKAKEIMKANPGMKFDAALAKAWEENPELMDEYDDEYFGR